MMGMCGNDVHKKETKIVTIIRVISKPTGKLVIA